MPDLNTVYAVYFLRCELAKANMVTEVIVLIKVGRKEIMYESNISDARWIAYDLPGNVGWILYFIGLILAFTKKPAFMEESVMFHLTVVAVIPALLMLIGIVELINERVHKLDRVLPHVRLFRGFGALTLGGIAGTVTAAVMLVCAIVTGTGELLYLCLMLAGGILCGLFAWLLFRRYKKK